MYDNLVKVLELSSPLDYKNYLLECPSTFGELLQLIKFFIVQLMHSVT